ncbi:MAG: hypothetical protein ACTSWN_04280 [Promethearchaeota archaeon]
MIKIGVKERLSALGSIIIGSTVNRELLTDLEKYNDAKVIKDNLEKKLIQKSKIEVKEFLEISNLGKGELETINICKKTGAFFVTDDHLALNYALRQGVIVKTSETILLKLLKRSIIKRAEFDNYIKKLIKIKSLKQDMIDFIYKKADEIS